MPKKTTLTCPFCSYKTTVPGAMGTHFQTAHSELVGLLPPDLTSRLKNKKKLTLSALVKEVGDWLQEGPDVRLSERVIKRLEESDAKVHVGLRVLAVDKLLRAMELGVIQRRLDREIKRRAATASLKNMDLKDLLNLSRTVQVQVQNDLRFVREVIALSTPPVGDAFARLLEMLAEVRAEALRGGETIVLHEGDFEVELPEKPHEREALRREVVKLLEEGGSQ